MLSNYYTLRFLAADLHSLLQNSPIEEAYCQNKNELVLSCRVTNSLRTLVISCEPSMNFVFLRGEVHRAKKNSVDVFRTLPGRIIRSVAIQPSDRELVIHLSGDVELLIRMYGSKANVLFVDKRGLVIDSFLNAKELRGTSISRDNAASQQAARDVVDFQTRLRSIGSIVITAATKKLFPLMNPILIREACFRADVNELRVVAELSNETITRLVGSCHAVLAELESAPRSCVYTRDGTPPLFSLIPLQHLSGAHVEQFESIHEAIRVFIGSNRKQKSLIREKEALLHFLRQGAEKAERTLQKMEQETAALERATRYELLGKLLMANLMQLRKGMAEAEFENVFSHDRELVSIRLDQKLTPARNAESYFDKAKKARAGIQEKIGHQDNVRERWELLRDFLDRASDLQTYEQLADFTAVHREELKHLGFKGVETEGGRKEQEIPFRQFVVAGGFQVWVGKSSENNDLLTMKYAKPSDLWFHARGSSGSHVILRMGTGKGEPGRKALEETAAIAAFYSKMKTAKHVPVAVTERKYVRKRRGAAAGTVTIEREKLLFVNPCLPEGMAEDRERQS
jgi:predicted ribosome quality control (RQC) complex YloA/Tae2 family protein